MHQKMQVFNSIITKKFDLSNVNDNVKLGIRGDNFLKRAIEWQRKYSINIKELSKLFPLDARALLQEHDLEKDALETSILKYWKTSMLAAEVARDAAAKIKDAAAAAAAAAAATTADLIKKGATSSVDILDNIGQGTAQRVDTFRHISTEQANRLVDDLFIPTASKITTVTSGFVYDTILPIGGIMGVLGVIWIIGQCVRRPSRGRDALQAPPLQAPPLQAPPLQAPPAPPAPPALQAPVIPPPPPVDAAEIARRRARAATNSFNDNAGGSTSKKYK